MSDELGVELDEATECGPDCHCVNTKAEGFSLYDQTFLRQEATRHAIDVIVAVNNTTAWVPQDTALFDMIHGFLKGESTPDPGAMPTDG